MASVRSVSSRRDVDLLAAALCVGSVMVAACGISSRRPKRHDTRSAPAASETPERSYSSFFSYFEQRSSSLGHSVSHVGIGPRRHHRRSTCPAGETLLAFYAANPVRFGHRRPEPPRLRLLIRIVSRSEVVDAQVAL
jgi:hypothetical protein